MLRAQSGSGTKSLPLNSPLLTPRRNGLKRLIISIEALFDNGTNQLAFNAALRCWLVEKDSSLEKHNRHELYSVFRKFVNESYEGTIEELMAELLEHCRAFKEQIRGPQVKRHLDWAVGEAPAGAANRIFGLN